MKNVYNIGRFRFDSYAEYRKGLADVKKIKYISDELDINEPGVALRLYTLIRQKDIKFQSVIGEDYLLYLSDLVADDYKELSDGTETHLAEPGGIKSPRRLAGILCIIAAILCFAYFLGNEYMNYQKSKEIRELKENKEISRAAQYIANVINDELNEKKEKDTEESQSQIETEERAAKSHAQEEKKEEVLAILPEYTDLYAQNPDLAGWIHIEDTEIDYPVMQSKKAADFYLKHNFEKQEDVNGSIFLDTRNDFINRDTNLIIYGHNMKSGLMFGGLNRYQDEEYFNSHKRVYLNTLYERQEYDIIAVCLTKVAYQDEDVFRYYNFLNAEDEPAFMDYKKNIAQMNVFGEDIDISYGDELLTLSTCDNYVEDGRLFLVAKRIKDTNAK